MIEVRNLVKRYGSTPAVDDLSFTVEDGQIYGFLGPNGAGKSTTMNIITGCLAATQGEVRINGFDIFSQPRQAKACIGYLPEQPPLYVDMTPQEYLLFIAQIKGVSKAQRTDKVYEVMHKTGILDVKDRLIKNLSKGYRQRVGLAQAILGDPPIIILDEPTVGLDPAQIVEIRTLIKSLAPEHTVIFSSHILSEVQEICSQILIISGGKLIAEDTPENLESRFVTNPVLHVTVNGAPDAVSQALETLEGVESVEMTPDEAQQSVEVTITCQPGAEVKAALSKALAMNECYVIRLEEGKASLEDVFMELISQDTATQTAETDDTSDEDDLVVDADALQNGEWDTVYDEHREFDAAADQESVIDELETMVHPDSADAEEDASAAEPTDNGEEASADGSDL